MPGARDSGNWTAVGIDAWQFGCRRWNWCLSIMPCPVSTSFLSTLRTPSYEMLLFCFSFLVLGLLCSFCHFFGFFDLQHVTWTYWSTQEELKKSQGAFS